MFYFNIATMSTNEDLPNKQLSDLNKRLGVIIALLLRPLTSEGACISLKEQVRILDGLGIRPIDIADILGRTASHINKELAGIRKAKSKKHAEKQ